MLGVYKVGLQIPALLPELQGAVRVFTSRGVYHLPAGRPRFFTGRSWLSVRIACIWPSLFTETDRSLAIKLVHKLVPVITSLTFGDVIGHDPRAATRIE